MNILDPKVTSNDLPRLVIAVMASAFFIERVLRSTRAARTTGSVDWSILVKARLSIVMVIATCWIAVSLLLRVPDAFMWPAVVVTTVAGLSYLWLTIAANRNATQAKTASVAQSTIRRRDEALERHLTVFVVASLGMSGGLVGLRLGLWWLTLPMVALLTGGWALLVVQEVKRGWQKR